MPSSLNELSKEVRHLLAAFVIALTFGYTVGMVYLQDMNHFKAEGIKEQYLGNEEDPSAEDLVFRSSPQSLLTTIHNHVISLALIFLAIGLITAMTPIPLWLKRLLIIEPFVSIITTFGGIWLMWAGVVWMKYIVMVSGVFMHGGFYAMAGICLVYLFSPKVREENIS